MGKSATINSDIFLGTENREALELSSLLLLATATSSSKEPVLAPSTYSFSLGAI